MGESKPTAARHRILIVDDHPLFRDGVTRFIDHQPDLICCGAADSIQAGREAAARLKPDLVLLDLRLRQEDGTELLKILQTVQPKLPVLVLSQRDDTLYALPCLRAGARGYIMKEEATDDLLTAIRCVLGGKLYVHPRLSGVLLSKFFAHDVDGAGPGAKLSGRELQIFQLVGSGRATQQIAEQLHLSTKTVETHRQNIKHKLGLPDAASLLRAAEDWLRASGE